MARLSSYSIISERLPGGGFALMSGLTGAIDLISEEVADMLKNTCTFRGNQGILRDFSKNKNLNISNVQQTRSNKIDLMPIPIEVINYLLKRGYFTNLTHEEERDKIRNLAEVLHSVQRSRPGFMIVPTFECNYRCTYCFERPLQNGLKMIGSDVNYKKRNVIMTPEQVEQIYKSIQQIKLESGDKRNGGLIILFGGEPLDSDNKDLVYDIVKRGVNNGFEFAAISNGHDLEEFLPLIGKGGIKQIQISIDGPKEIHDRRRIYRKGGSSFDRIMSNIHSLLKQSDVLLQLRVHIESSNIGSFNKLLDEFRAEGLLNNKSVVIYTNTVYSKSPGGRVSSNMEDSEIKRHLRNVCAGFNNVFITATDVNSRMNVLPSLMKGTPFQLHSTYCAANAGNYIFAPDGHIYACWESVGLPCSKVGSYMTEQGLIFDKNAVGKWFNRSTARIPECLECPFCLVCGGGCAQFAEYNDGTLYKPYCDDYERTFRDSLAGNVEEFLRRFDMQKRGRKEMTGLLEQYYG